MVERNRPRVAIVDYGMGNLFSVKHACETEGLSATITSARAEVLAADAVIVPGIGAFRDAMQALRQHDLVTALQEVAASAKPLVGICLGMQLLMTESFEFGCHAGLGIIPGSVVSLRSALTDTTLKVPQVGWNTLRRPALGSTDPWSGTLLNGLPDSVYMYFVHSFFCQPADSKVVLAVTRYGDAEFCSSLRYRNIFACQCHPERSGALGLRVYRNLAAQLNHLAVTETING